MYISRLTDALVTRGHEVHILTSYAKARSVHWHQRALTIKEIGTGEKRAAGWEDICYFIRQWEPDIILTHHFFIKEFAQEFSSAAFSKLGTPFIEIVHSQPRHPSASFAIFNSEYTAKRQGWKEGDVVMLPPADERCVSCRHEKRGGGNDYLSCLDCGYEWDYRKQEYDGLGRNYIGHIKPIPNRYWKGQGWGKGINVTYGLAHVFPERKFLVLKGEWSDFEEIRQLPNVEFMEPVDDIRDFYARCRIVVMPSAHEDAGTVPLECALNGIPCISSDAGGLPETNRGGILLPINDLPAWSKAITDLDNALYYETVANRQRAALPNWEEKFDEIDRKIRAL